MKKFIRQNFVKILSAVAIIFFLCVGTIIFWIATIDVPSIQNFDTRRVSESTKIFDKTGQVILYDVHGEVRRTIIPFEKISQNIKNATIATEDADFYKHHGVQPTAVLRAIGRNLLAGKLFGGQGGSTITQQVIKNSLLSSDKTLTRKIKEWVLAPRLEQLLSKDQILNIYLNEIPYGGTVYGVEEASQHFFGKSATDLTIVEAAYLAALPQAPTYYSPYGNHREDLENRKNYVLRRMKDLGYITEKDYEDGIKQKVDFQKQESFGIKAPHFVMYIKEYLEKKYGKDMVENGGLKVITTLDYEYQKKGEELAKKWALANEKSANASNAAFVAVDPNNGQIVTMVGSRDYFDEKIDGNFNIATAQRQPGSSFKPFVYAEAFSKGYRPETILFDLPTEFSSVCGQDVDSCYSPINYDGLYRGPMTLRNALAQSINIPAVKLLYLVGLKDALALAKKFGLETLKGPDQYGLTLVLGGGEVKPIEMAGAYSVFATGGVKHKVTGILKVEDRTGKVLEEFKDESERVIDEQVAYTISDILSDNNARTPIFGANSALYIPGRQVAAKTGTTNNYRDAWIVGYTPDIVLAAWVGNNDNTPIEKKAAGLIVAPMWNEFMREFLKKTEAKNFPKPDLLPASTKPMIAGAWNINGQVHSILYWVDKNNPLGPQPTNPSNDPQFVLWETPVQEWLKSQGMASSSTIPGQDQLVIVSPQPNSVSARNMPIKVTVGLLEDKIKSGVISINGAVVGNLDPSNSFSFTPQNIAGIEPENTLRIDVKTEGGKNKSAEVFFGVKD